MNKADVILGLPVCDDLEQVARISDRPDAEDLDRFGCAVLPQLVHVEVHALGHARNTARLEAA
jgi:hypothetical protein